MPCAQTQAHGNIQEFLEYVHNIFNKPWEQYNAHFHIDNTVGDGRVSSSEWEAGGYFEAEFVVDGRIVLFAQSEDAETRTREPEPKEAEKGESWRWGWQGSEGPEDRVCLELGFWSTWLIVPTVVQGEGSG